MFSGASTCAAPGLLEVTIAKITLKHRPQVRSVPYALAQGKLKTRSRRTRAPTRSSVPADGVAGQRPEELESGPVTGAGAFAVFTSNKNFNSASMPSRLRRRSGCCPRAHVIAPTTARRTSWSATRFPSSPRRRRTCSPLATTPPSLGAVPGHREDPDHPSASELEGPRQHADRQEVSAVGTSFLRSDQLALLQHARGRDHRRGARRRDGLSAASSTTR